MALTPRSTAHYVSGRCRACSLRPGEDVHVEISLVPARAAHISGRVVNPDGTPGQGHVVLCDAWAGPARVTVAGENISDLVLTTAPRGTLSGQVVFDTGVPPADQPSEAFDFMAFPGPSSSGRISANDDWTFTVEGIASP